MNASQDVAGPPVRIRWFAVAAAGAVTVLALMIIAKVSALERSPGWSGPVVAIVFAATVVILVALTRGTNSVAAWVAVFGGALSLVGSGLTRPRRQVSPARGSGEVVGRLDTWWPILVAGIVIGLGAVLVTYERRHNVIDRVQSAALSVLSLSLGTAVVVFLMRDLVTGHVIEGRPVRRRGRLVLPDARSESASVVRDAWLAAADHETAAVAAFTTLADRLRKIGAPPDLIQRCRRAADDETRHARQCARLAAASGSTTETATDPTRRSKRPGRVRSRRVELIRIALESFADGMVNEGFAAARLQRSAASADAETARCLRRMARDERRHASLAADIVRWCRNESGFLLDAALGATAARLPVVRPFPVRLRGLDRSALAAAGLGDASTSTAAWAETRLRAQKWLAHEARRLPAGPAPVPREFAIPRSLPMRRPGPFVEISHRDRCS